MSGSATDDASIWKVGSDPRLRAKAPKSEAHYPFSSRIGSDPHTQAQREVVERCRIPLALAVRCANESKAYDALFKDLLCFIFLIVPFVFFVLFAFDTKNMYFLGLNVAGLPATSAIPSRDRINFPPTLSPTWGMTFEDPHQIDDWYWWAQTTLLNTYFDASNPSVPYADGYPLPGNTIPIGALRFRVVRVGSKSCTPKTDFFALRDICYDESGGSVNTSQYGAFQFYNCPHPYLTRTESLTYFFDCGGNVLDVPFSLSYNDAQSQIRTLLPSNGSPGFVDPGASRLLVVSTITYNPTSQYFGLTNLMIELTQGGKLIVEARFQPFEVWSRDYVFGSVYLIVYFIVVLCFIGRFFWNAATADKKLKHLLSFWTMLEMFNLGIFFIMFIIRFVWWGQSAKESFRLVPGSTAYPGGLEYVAALYVTQLRLNSINTVLIFLQVLKYTSLSSGLSVVTRSIYNASKNIVGLLSIFVIVLLAYSIAGNTLFGGRMYQFRDISTSFSTNMRMLIGDSDFDSMQAVDMYLAGLYYWSFLILGLFLLLNFIIAVIGDAFDCEAAEIGDVSVYEELSIIAGAVVRSIRRFVRDPRSWAKGLLAILQSRWGREGAFSALKEVLELEAKRTDITTNIEGLKGLQLIVAEHADEKKRLCLTDAFVEDFWEAMHDKHRRLASTPARMRTAAHEALVASLVKRAVDKELKRPDGTSRIPDMMQPASDVVDLIAKGLSPALHGTVSQLECIPKL